MITIEHTHTHTHTEIIPAGAVLPPGRAFGDEGVPYPPAGAPDGDERVGVPRAPNEEGRPADDTKVTNEVGANQSGPVEALWIPGPSLQDGHSGEREFGVLPETGQEQERCHRRCRRSVALAEHGHKYLRNEHENRVQTMENRERERRAQRMTENKQ